MEDKEVTHLQEVGMHLQTNFVEFMKTLFFKIKGFQNADKRFE